MKFTFPLYLLYVLLSFGQQDSVPIPYDKGEIWVREITEEDLLAYREDPSFDYEIIKAEPTWWDDFKTWLGNLLLRFFEWLFGVEKASGFKADFLQVIPYLLLGVLLFLLIRFFLSVNSKALFYARRNEVLVSLSEEEEIIKNQNILKLIQEALKGKNYRLAIRYYYLHILQLLSDQELIDWQLQKTNGDYLEELVRTELKPSFARITQLYDYIWYGGFDIDENRFKKAETAFIALQKQIDHG
ncbi:MAG: DUF4129 domain-containing protein [Bacteroidota bacterium]